MRFKANPSAKVWIAALFLGVGFARSARAWQSDRGDGTFTNPPLYADYPDPDIIRVGGDFYLVSTTFVDSPGINILRSQDLVNWRIVAHAASVVNGGNRFNLQGGTAYRQGFWAASIRYRNGMFYVVDNPTFGNARIYYAAEITGPWRYHVLNRPAYDPGFYIGADGTGYIVCGNTDLSLLTLNSDYSRVISVKRHLLVYRGIEGSHLIKRGEYYYLFNADPSLRPFALLCSRSTRISGPYETIKSLDDPSGGHQGGIVELANGRWYGFVMKDCGAIGRMTYISPIFWRNGWPVWGTRGAPGRVPAAARIPVQGGGVCQPATSDAFDSPTLGLQWQWNHNPDNSRWSLTARPGFLRLKPTRAANFWLARNTLTQKGQGPWSCGEVKLDLRHLRAGDVCGFGTLGKTNGQISVNCGNTGAITLKMNVIVPLNPSSTELAQTSLASAAFAGTTLYLRTELDFTDELGICSYSADGANWSVLGGPFKLEYDWRTGTFQGEKYAIFCFNPNPGDGYVDVDWFRFRGTRRTAMKRTAESPSLATFARGTAQASGGREAHSRQRPGVQPGAACQTRPTGPLSNRACRPVAGMAA
ncbi:MAG: glycoside hydrolase family 43 protein [Opitutaceae bacterium]